MFLFTIQTRIKLPHEQNNYSFGEKFIFKSHCNDAIKYDDDNNNNIFRKFQ